jgi:CDP-paratose 2-epimerase
MTGHALGYTLVDRPRAGDHIWYVSDVRKFQADYPEWSYRYDQKAILAEIVDATRERLRGPAGA